MKKLWFKRKTYGWGWTPTTWQGWGITIGYIVVMIAVGFFLDPDTHSDSVWIFSGAVVIFTILFIYIAYKTGEKPRWQWGGREEHTDDNK